MTPTQFDEPRVGDHVEWISVDQMLPQIVRRIAHETPEKVYLRHVDGPTRSYRQTLDAGLHWAAALRRVGIGRGDRVLSMLPNGFDTYDAWFGMAWLGAVEVSLNTGYRGRMLAYTINTAEASTLIIDRRYVDALAAVSDELGQLERVIVVGAEDELPALPRPAMSAETFLANVGPDDAADLEGPAPWDTACIIWTSGTTGPSKGVMVPWAELHSFCDVVNGVADVGAVVYHFMPPFHVGGKLLLYAAAINDAELIVRETFSVSGFWNDVRRFGVTHTNIQGPMVEMLMNAPPSDDDTDNTLRTMGCAPLPATLEDFVRRFDIKAVNTYYGMTETGLPFMSEGRMVANLTSCGKLREGYEVRIVDDHDYPVAPGEIGELIVRANHPWVMNAGYYGMSTATADAWINGWFHTGDAFRVDEDGNYYFIDRIKDAIRRRGENISSFEVEGYVLEHPDIAAVAAVGVPSELGEDEVKVVVVRADGATVSAEDLIAWLQPRMPRFMLPRYIEFVSDLPRTEATLRVKKAELRRADSVEVWDRQAMDARFDRTSALG